MACQTFNIFIYLWTDTQKQFNLHAEYSMSGDFMSLLQELIPEAIPSQACPVNMGLILCGYRIIGNSIQIM